MSNRGKINKITFEIEYPDGSKKVAVLEKELGDLSAIVFGESQVKEHSRSEWGDSKNWKDNPTMLLIDNEGRSNPYCRWKHHQKVWEDQNPK
ncbi:hypothetical protein QX220_21975 [Vibrio vulnificus]|uniref:hypothetical protein n=1 Tax=Vibrio vulnificus TaxID=672 RepID=UPI000DAC747B|nr:hypothetical protein [Vibrio vulnificus]EHZ7360244.1 hypothetical protein [Vibrio vulnificus]EIH0733783.1 hypothetical protein [Vibrio vulnificus]EIH1439249.1 hypothetical protein [Vibrio vulnificus]MBY7715191.1 hypothetical protein [Vibrio vulnificus]MBY7724500.1 hypothetical protein [Vibrio vulnificus]